MARVSQIRYVVNETKRSSTESLRVQGLTDDGACDGVVCIPESEPSQAFICLQVTGNDDKLSRRLLFWLRFEELIPPQLGSIIDSAGNRPATPVSAKSPNTAINARKDMEKVRSTVSFQDKD